MIRYNLSAGSVPCKALALLRLQQIQPTPLPTISDRHFHKRTKFTEDLYLG